MNQTATLQKLEEMRLNGFARIYRQMQETGNNRDFKTDEYNEHDNSLLPSCGSILGFLLSTG